MFICEYLGNELKFLFSLSAKLKLKASNFENKHFFKDMLSNKKVRVKIV